MVHAKAAKMAAAWLAHRQRFRQNDAMSAPPRPSSPATPLPVQDFVADLDASFVRVEDDCETHFLLSERGVVLKLEPCIGAR
jgi:hypothetical protein